MQKCQIFCFHPKFWCKQDKILLLLPNLLQYSINLLRRAYAAAKINLDALYPMSKLHFYAFDQFLSYAYVTSLLRVTISINITLTFYVMIFDLFYQKFAKCQFTEHHPCSNV